MEPRYWLRFESGERRGERLPIPEPGLVLGRGADCGLRLPERSVSGRHARLEVEPSGVRVTDLESRNGTAVNGEPVASRLLAHGDELKVGKVRLVLVDRGLVAGADPEAPTLAPGDDAADGTDALLWVDSGLVRASRRSSPLVWIALVLALAAGGAYAWRELGSAEVATQRLRPVEAVAGDLLRDGSFEDPSTLASWESAEAGLFEIASDHRNRGAQGLGAELGEGARFRLASPWCRARVGRAVSATLWARFDRGLDVQAGIELSSSDADHRTLELRGARLDAGGDFEETRLTENVLPGFERARLVLVAQANEPGTFELDDVSLVETDPKEQGRFAFEEFELQLHGTSLPSASLVRIDRVVLSGLRFSADGRPSDFDVRPEPNGFELGIPSGAGDVRFECTVDEGAAALGLATLHRTEGSTRGGLRARSGEFTAEEASGLLVGRGTLLVRLGFEQPVRLEAHGRPEGIRVETGPIGGPVRLQLSFREERNRAADLAEAATRATREDRPGVALARWAELLEGVPFDAGLVARAVEARSELLRAGLREVEAVRTDFSRARFFDLPEIYRRNARRVAELRERYAGSEVDEEASALADEIRSALAAHVDEEQEAQRARLERVGHILERDGAEELASHVLDEAERPGASGEGDGR